ncbi:MAG: hypothetical protein KAI64_05070, partial [Thermoplasmata archaeon]|nr:hypothetical protein [Thermoplasmata archaeon]
EVSGFFAQKAIINLSIEYLKPPVLIGDEGKIFNVTSNIGTIYGYSQTRLLAQGVLFLNGTSYDVQGLAWIDHQWGSWSYTNQEYWQVQLKNGIDITVFRLFSGDLLVYEDYFEVDSNGGLTSVDTYEVEYLEYLISPGDPLKKRCVTIRWRFISSIHNLTAEHTVKYQFSGPLEWEGSITEDGIVRGFVVQGRGFALTNNHANAEPLISNVTDYHDPAFPIPPTRVTANVTDEIPIANVTLKYNTSLNATIMNVSMSHVIDNLWEGYIPPQAGMATVYYFVEAYDVVGAYAKSEEFSYDVT